MGVPRIIRRPGRIPAGDRIAHQKPDEGIAMVVEADGSSTTSVTQQRGEESGSHK